MSSSVHVFASQRIFIGGFGEYAKYFSEQEIDTSLTSFYENKTEEILVVNSDQNIEALTLIAKDIGSLQAGTLYHSVVDTKVQGEIIYSLYINEHTYLTIGNILDSLGNKRGSYISYTSHNMVRFYKSYDGVHALFAKDLVVVKDAIFVLFERNVTAQNTNIGVLELTMQGVEVRRKEFIGDQEDIGKHIYYHNNHLYITGDSSSTTGVYANHPKQHVFIFLVYIHNFNQVQLKSIGNNGLNHLIDSTFFQGKIYCLVKLGGSSGAYQLPEGSYHGHMLIELDRYLEEIGKSYFSQQTKGVFEEIFITETSLFVLQTTYEDNKSWAVVYQFNQNMYYMNTTKIPIAEQGNYIEKTTAFVDGDIFVHFSIWNTEKSEYQHKLLCMNKELEIVYNSHLFEEITALVFGYFHTHTLYVYIVNKDNQTEQVAVTFVKIDPVLVQNNSSITIDIWIHDAKKIVAESTFQQANRALFGISKVGFVYQDDKICVVLLENVYIPSNVNVAAGETYDIGVSLDFYGEGRLNEIKIPKETSITKEGRYLLEVIGYQEKRSIEFFVEAISLSLPEMLEVKQILSEVQNDCLFEEKVSVVYVYNNQTKEEQASIWGFLSLVGVFGVLVGFSSDKIRLKVGKNRRETF